MYTVFLQFFDHKEFVSFSQIGHAVFPFVLYPDKFPYARKSLIVQKIMALSWKLCPVYASYTSMPEFHIIFISSINGAKYTSMSFQGCFGP